jgi:hypothetical protein
MTIDDIRKTLIDDIVDANVEFVQGLHNDRPSTYAFAAIHILENLDLLKAGKITQSESLNFIREAQKVISLLKDEYGAQYKEKLVASVAGLITILNVES